MSDQLTFEGGEATGAVPEGTNQAEITSVELDDSSGFEYVRIEMVTETDVEMNVSYPAPEDKLTSNHGLGQAVERFGQPVEEGATIDLNEIFAVGKEVEFEAVEDEDSGYMEVEPDSFRPAGSGQPTSTQEQAKTNGDLSDQVKQLVDDHNGQDQNALIGAAAQQGGDLVEEVQEAIDAGQIQVQDGEVVGY